MTDLRTISFMPPWFVGTLEFSTLRSARATSPAYQCARPADFRVLGEGLREAQRRLAAWPAREIVLALDEVARRWQDRGFGPRLRARDDVVEATGFSAEAVERSFDVELRNYRAGALERALRRELGAPEVLDGFVFQRELSGLTHALGPTVTLAVFTGNVPGLPALSMVRALLVKSAVIAKVASGEPTFAAHFARTVHEVSPVLGDALAVTYWERDDHASLHAAIGESDAVIAYGGEEACATVRAAVGPGKRYLEHGHKLSVGILGGAYLADLGLEEVARRVAIDVSVFNQHACIAPQAYLVEGDADDARAFGSALARALDEYAAGCPLGTLDEADAASLQLRRASAAYRAATHAEADLFQPTSLDWTVTVDAEIVPLIGGGNRVVKLVPCRDLHDAVAQLRPIGRYLQNVGVGAFGPALIEAATALARLGASRVSEPGRMAEPSMIWRHDGEPCLAQLVRWCDVEHHRGAVASSDQPT